MKQPRKILLAFVSTAIFLSIVQIIFSAAFTTAGIDLSQLQYEKKGIETDNMIIGEALYTKSSFTTIAKIASEEGFAQDTKSRISLTTTSSVALNR